MRGLLPRRTHFITSLATASAAVRVNHARSSFQIVRRRFPLPRTAARILGGKRQLKTLCVLSLPETREREKVKLRCSFPHMATCTGSLHSSLSLPFQKPPLWGRSQTLASLHPLTQVPFRCPPVSNKRAARYILGHLSTWSGEETKPLLKSRRKKESARAGQSRWCASLATSRPVPPWWGAFSWA